MTRTVVVTYPGFDLDDERTAGALRAAGLALRCEPRVAERTPAEMAGIMGAAVAGIVSTDPFDATVFAACPSLRVLARVGVGTDTIDLAAATEAGVAVTITPGKNANTVADHTLALMLACTRRLRENDAAIREGRWDRGRGLTGGDLSGATVGIIGLGTIGTAVARRLPGFDVEILGADPTRRELPAVAQVPLDELLQRADVITLHVPLLDSTRALIGERELALMRDGAILVNTARGAVVDEAALVDALGEGRLAAAGLDVFADEPPAGSPLLSLANVVLSPHIGGISVASQQAMLEMATDTVLAVVAGRQPDGLVNPRALAKGSDLRAEVA
jgi:phosphoglycerate dehydrogenase-like enzyme